MSLPELKAVTELVESVVDEEKKNLVDSVVELEEQRETNEFLAEIAEDYQRYQEMLLDQKQQQQQQLVHILAYLDSLLETQAITKYTLDHTHNEQKRIVNEIKELQKEMDNIILD